MALTQEAVLCFLLERGGKVKNSELVNHFKSLINSGDPAEKQHNRELFKKLVNSVAVVRQIDEVKFVVVRKRYQDFVREEMDQSLFGQTANSNARRSSSVSNYYSDDKSCVESLQESGPAVSTADSATVKVLNISRDQPCRASKSGAVFAVIAVRSPERDSAAGARDGLRSQVHQQHGNPDKAVIRVPSLPAPTSNSSSHQRELIKEPQCWKSKQTEAKQAPGSPLVRPQNKTLRQADDESVPLEPIAHEWLVKCAAGLWGQIYALLLQDTRLAQKKDFMSGFTALHWAAKDGSCEIIHKLIDVSRKRGTCVNVNSKAHGGYTPLHIAAMHGHSEVMVALVQRYGASVSERDNDGKKALHYLGKGASAEVRALLGGPQQSGEKMEGEEYQEHTRGFNTISKLFHPHLGKKHKTCRFAHEW
ncbi:PREDICTED: ankyrin repeat domain-containing protein SOWAHA [Poecilia mexicana]|uniref:ankyrin repeat domain-containing protein SOWAHA n=1 Tax=Poecilia mexicana TaxID=48701 RepID=UPI00072DDA62|nr:PREDICTED: ankyrin repeat domain-containing protein SOWAHA [Poecilia mexicana]